MNIQFCNTVYSDVTADLILSKITTCAVSFVSCIRMKPLATTCRLKAEWINSVQVVSTFVLSQKCLHITTPLGYS